MSVLVLGLNYRTAPIGMLERVAVPAEHLPKALASLLNREHVLEAVVLSTCNRVEVYAHVPRYHGGMADLRNFFAEWAGMAPEDFADLAYDYYDERAAEHLFAVASGLDSMVVGERQIHLQVKAAFRDAEAQAATGRVLSSLFGQALRVGKRSRTETGIAEGAASMVDVGLDAAARVLGNLGAGELRSSTACESSRAALAGRTVLVVGAGKMGGMAATRVAGEAGRILIANRSAEKGERLALRVDGDVLDFRDLHDGLRRADLVLCSTGSPAPVVDQDAVAEAMQQRPGRPLVLVDLAVPRDVDPGCSFVPGVTVLDIDAVRELTDVTETGIEVAKAREVVVDEARRFAAWTRAVRVEPTIAALRTHAEVVRQAELQRVAGRLGDLDERQRATVDALTSRIVNTLLHEPSVRLKAIADARGGDLYAAALRELFDLPE
ncbi:MAG: glutamyl-tRNA reductase [Euzebyales bacterium]|nr:glutamyl-tRNA reductase [Euzebyales bacterium]MDQ3341965.1 glutamyl-tRNA reductase [Actinomycetota bacterium]